MRPGKSTSCYMSWEKYFLLYDQGYVCDLVKVLPVICPGRNTSFYMTREKYFLLCDLGGVLPVM